METKVQEKKAAIKKTANNGKATVKETTAKTTAIETVKSILTPTAESRIKKLENMQRLADRHLKLTAKRDELDSFNLGVDNLHERLEIHNSKEVFIVSNSQVIEAVKALMDAELNKLIEVSNNEIVNYSI